MPAGDLEYDSVAVVCMLTAMEFKLTIGRIFQVPPTAFELAAMDRGVAGRSPLVWRNN